MSLGFRGKAVRTRATHILKIISQINVGKHSSQQMLTWLHFCVTVQLWRGSLGVARMQLRSMVYLAFSFSLTAISVRRGQAEAYLEPPTLWTSIQGTRRRDKFFSL